MSFRRVVAVSVFAFAVTGAQAGLEVDFSVAQGEVRRLNGINGGPSARTKRWIEMQDFKALAISDVRLHDVPLVDAGFKLVDVQDIFPIWNESLDPKDARNYFFGPTDGYLKTLKECGVRSITYRLGTSIEHTGTRSWFAVRPKNAEWYAEICAGIVRHYTKGWADGFDAGEVNWEIWNEPDMVGCMWDGTLDDYYAFYITVAKRLEKEFPGIRVGGPAIARFRLEDAQKFIRLCDEAGAPIRFYSWHGYIQSERGEFHLVDIEKFRAWLDANGHKDMKLHFNEWHYFPCSWGDLRTPEGVDRWGLEAADGMGGIDAAAFTTWCLTKWQELPLDVANFYMFSSPKWGLYDVAGAKRPTYCALKLFADFLGGGATRVRAQGEKTERTDIAVLGGISTNGCKRVLISDFKPINERIGSIRELAVRGVPAAGRVRVKTLDAADRSIREESVEYKDGKIALPRCRISGSAVWLVEFAEP